MGSIVFGEKLRRPDPAGLPRPRLEQRLTGASAPSVGLVLGPPGSGKTTLLTRVAALAARPSAWYRAGAEDNDEAALIAHLAHGLGAALGDPAVAASADVGTVAALVAALERGPAAPVQLVVDDLHELIGTSAEVALEQFCRWRPHRVGLLLGSRRPPGINTSRLLVSGELGQLDAEDLRFRSWEVEELFRAVYAPAVVAGDGCGADPAYRRLGGRTATVPPRDRRSLPARAGAGRRRAQRTVAVDPLLSGPQRAGRAGSDAAHLPAAELHARAC